MNTEADNIGMPTTQKPQVYLKTIVFNDGTLLNLNHNSIVVFTGANNSGKSQVLKDIENGLNKQYPLSTVVAQTLEYDYYGDIYDPTFFNARFFRDEYGNYQIFEMPDSSFDRDSIQIWWENRELYANLHRLFIRRLCTELRLSTSNALDRSVQPEKNPIYKLHQSEVLAQKLSDYFRQAFSVDLIVNRNDMRYVPLHTGQAPDRNAYTIANQDEYYRQVAELPKLQEQGDGMRSFASILLDTFTSEYPITLIDEPEAFLHPPQARMLGKMLAKHNPNNRQLFISTHSEDFLQGLLDADNENVTVIRINRAGNLNRMSILNNNEIKQLWGNPILRYSNILSGLFHEKVVVCESDYDCLFYQAVMTADYEHRNEIAPDILFTHCGGKSRAKDITKALRAVNVPVVAICDFDLLNASQNLRPLTESLGLAWNVLLDEGMRTIFDSMNAKNSSGINAWEQIKKIGKAGFTGDEPAAYEKVENLCKSVGLFVVPVGEMEGFVKTINKEKKEWVYEVLEKCDLATEPKLEEARRFTNEIVGYTPCQ